MNYTAAPPLFFFFFFFVFLFFVTSANKLPIYRTCGLNNKPSYPPSTIPNDPIFSTFLTNLTLAASANCSGYATGFLINKTIGNTTSTYSATEGIYAFAQCRKDLILAGDNKTCKDCLAEAIAGIQYNCLDRTNTMIFYEYCMLRYTNFNSLGEVDTSISPVVYANQHDSKNATAFDSKLIFLMGKIKDEATAPSSKIQLGKNSTYLWNFVNLYGLVQCTGGISNLECRECLDQATNAMSDNGTCTNKVGCQVISPMCYLRYEIFKFYSSD